MSKKQRHKCKKTERARRVRASRKRQIVVRRGAAAMTTAAAIAVGTSAYANPIRFDNPAHGEPGHFEWAVDGAETWLDFTQPANVQTGTETVNSSVVHYFDPLYYGNVFVSGGSVQNNPDPDYFVMGVDSGEPIPSGLLWSSSGYVNYNGTSYLPDGIPTYLGLRFDLGSGYQYGWIGVVRNAFELDAFAWGYETEPGVPIAAGAPEPGSLALLAFGAAGVASRRRRLND